MGLDASSVGNHEFDKGMADLTDRVIPRADFPYLGANVYRGDERALPAYCGADRRRRPGRRHRRRHRADRLAGQPGRHRRHHVPRSPVPEAEAVAAELKDGNEANGEADVVVLVAHEGADLANIATPEALAADPVFGEFVDASADIDVIVSGHTHQPYAFMMPVPGSDKLRPVLEAQEYGRKLGKVNLTISPEGEVTDASVGLLDVVGAPIDPEIAALVATAKANADVLGQRPLGSITADIKRAVTATGTEDRGKESVLGNFVADVQLAGTSDPGRGGAQIAFMNAGGLRADLLYAPDGVVTYSEAFLVQPFANDVVTKTYTGAQIKAALEQMWQPAGASRPVLWLGVSDGFTFTYLPDNAQGSRITSMSLNGTPINPTGTYRVTVNSFLASGGDNFAALAGGTDRVTTGDNDLTMLTDYLGSNSPVTADTAPRSSVGQPGPTCTTTITGPARRSADRQHGSDLCGQRDGRRTGHGTGRRVAHRDRRQHRRTGDGHVRRADQHLRHGGLRTGDRDRRDRRGAGGGRSGQRPGHHQQRHRRCTGRLRHRERPGHPPEQHRWRGGGGGGEHDRRAAVLLRQRSGAGRRGPAEHRAGTGVRAVRPALTPPDSGGPPGEPAGRASAVNGPGRRSPAIRSADPGRVAVRRNRRYPAFRNADFVARPLSTTHFRASASNLRHGRLLGDESERVGRTHRRELSPVPQAQAHLVVRGLPRPDHRDVRDLLPDGLPDPQPE